MVLWLEHETQDLEVVGSSPGRATLVQGCTLGQALPHLFQLTQV